MNNTNWQQWKYAYKEKIKHIVGFEEKFVDTVLSEIPEITPSDVIPQYHFTDDKGGNRYIDFMIINKEKNYQLPIELDGYSKMVGNQNNYAKFNDFLERQNSIIANFGIVLRYSNKTMLNNSQNIINEIRQTLNNQQQVKSNQQIKEIHKKQMIEDYEKRIDELSKKQSSNNENILPLLKEMQAEMSKLRQAQQPIPSSPKKKITDETEKKSNNIIIWGIVISILAAIIFYFVNVNSNRSVNTYSTQNVNTSYTVGINQQVCGKLAYAKKFSKGYYLSLGKPYPKEDITIVLWGGTSKLFNYVGKNTVCATGDVTENNKGKLKVLAKGMNSLTFK